MGLPYDQQQLDDVPPRFVRRDLPTLKRRGRPPNHPALQDFTLEQIDRFIRGCAGGLRQIKRLRSATPIMSRPANAPTACWHFGRESAC